MSATTAIRTTRRAAPPAFRLRGATYKAVLTTHILASVGWFGTAIVVAFCAVAAGLHGDPTTSRAFYRVMEQLPGLSIPLGALAVASGAVLSLGTTWGLFRYWWVVAKIVIAFAVIVTDALIVRGVAHHALTTGEVVPAVYGSTIAHVAVLAIATALSVFKPRQMTPWFLRHDMAHS